jgi:hypothetical protein
MPDLEQRVRDGLDRLTQRPDAGRIVGQVARRKRHLHVMHRVQIVALVVATVAGVAGGVYGLSQAFHVGAPRLLPGNTGVHPSGQQVHPMPSLVRHTPSSVHATPSSGPSSASGPALPLCSDETARVKAVSQHGAAGTISTLWRVTNTAKTSCRSFGYPGMDFRASSGWLNVQVHRGGFANINYAPASVVLQPGGSLYFVSNWNDATTAAGPCRSFDRVKVTLPDNRISTVVVSSGCLTPTLVDVGPVSKTPPK